MNNTFKKFLAVLLSVLTCLSCGLTAFAEGETVPAEKPETDFTCYRYQLSDYSSTDFIVVTFDSKYSQTGEIPEVYLYSSQTSYKKPIADDIITMINEHEGKRYPQLFIKTEKLQIINNIVIYAGAFVTESGEISGKVEIPSNKIIKASDPGVSCMLEAFELEENIDLITSKTCRYTTVGKPVKIVATSEYGKIWLDEITATYTVNGNTVEINSNEFVPQEPGSYVVELKLGDIITRKLEFDVLSENAAYSKNLLNATEWLLLSPLCFLLGTGLFVLIPGFGTVFGSMAAIASVYMIPRFFIALFEGPVYEEYILE